MPGVQVELESHIKEHKAVDKFQSNVEKCTAAKVIIDFNKSINHYI